MGTPRDHRITFTGPGEQEVQLSGRYLRVLSAPSGNVFLQLDSSAELERGAGQGIDFGRAVGRLRVRSAVAQTVLISFSDEPQDDARSNVALSVSATVSGSTAATPKAAVTVPAGNKVKLADANADRVELRLAIASSEPGPVFLGDSTIVAGEGGLLEPGMVDYLATTAEVWAFNAGAADVEVSVLDLEDP